MPIRPDNSLKVSLSIRVKNQILLFIIFAKDKHSPEDNKRLSFCFRIEDKILLLISSMTGLFKILKMWNKQQQSIL
jgi:hypothetical protein